MSKGQDQALCGPQLDLFGALLRRGAREAAAALERWIERPTKISIDAVEKLPISEATGVLGVDMETIGFCVAEIRGRFTGELILAFDDESGLSLADMLLHQPSGTAKSWGDMETSAALETTNIVGSTCLNVLNRDLPQCAGKSELILSPPRFNHDFAESLLEFALMGQAVSSDEALIARVQFRIDNAPVRWTLLILPDANGMSILRELLNQ